MDRGMMAADPKERLRLILTEEEADAIFAQGREAVIFHLLNLSKRLQELESKSSSRSASTPSGMIPPYEKPCGKKRRRKPGRKAGHPGCRRAGPPKIDRKEEHRLVCCPHCQNPLDPNKPVRRRSRIVEDLTESEPEVVEHAIWGSWCPVCKKIVEPVVQDALPNATVGHQAVALTSWLHYGLGITLSQIVEVLDFHLHFPVSPGGLVQMWYRIQAIFHEWYDAIATQALESVYLHGDETGWRVNGNTHWLWCFTNEDLTYYLIDRSRGSPALKRFFGEEFKGCLITDFWKAYDLIRTTARQYCLAHLLREIHEVDERNQSGEWIRFSKRLRRLLADALRLAARRENLGEEKYQSKNRRFDQRIEELVLHNGAKDPDVNRLSKRLIERMDGLFTFLDHPEVAATNNRAEREIRPAVIIRKNSLQNRSEKGAECQAVFMSIYRTLKRRGYDPIQTMVEALRTYVREGTLPPMPDAKERAPP